MKGSIKQKKGWYYLVVSFFVFTVAVGWIWDLQRRFVSLSEVARSESFGDLRALREEMERIAAETRDRVQTSSEATFPMAEEKEIP
ncbi:MAG TPA: hypothetical protein VJB99_01730 [Patescibacteria group bacterium]|nr:hypothetical protein [Patescibacteria group bacterium]